ncbi:MAG: hypothetical protein AAB778_04105 [Patescibacteria group bacterium]
MSQVQKNLQVDSELWPKKQPTGSSSGRWDDIRGVTPNEVESDDSNPQ